MLSETSFSLEENVPTPPFSILYRLELVDQDGQVAGFRFEFDECVPTWVWFVLGVCPPQVLCRGCLLMPVLVGTIVTAPWSLRHAFAGLMLSPGTLSSVDSRETSTPFTQLTSS
jgi:hypothetical protein